MDSDSDHDIDIASKLLSTKSNNTNNKTKPQHSSAARNTPSQGNPTRARLDSNTHHDSDDDDDDDDDEDQLFASLSSLNRTRNLADATDVVKQRKDLKQTRGLTGGGSFQSLGLPPALFKTLLQRGFTQPTPIQRLALPSILGSTETLVAGKRIVVARDHLCMARTGSGKTLCYLLPLLSQLMTHSTTFGPRALILVPTRELALQVLKVGKDLARGLKSEGEVLRWAMIVGGESMEEQFDLISGNPDVIIATPGRLLHLIVEMQLDLKTVQYCVFDEADRLFELGFDEQLHEILYRLPSTRQTLLFSATLPSSLVGFAKAGLQNPKLVRLDVDSKISKDLQMSYISIKSSEKEALLLGLLREVIQIPLMSLEQRADLLKSSRDQDSDDDDDNDHERGNKHRTKRNKSFNHNNKRRKHESTGPDADNNKIDPSAHQTVVFVSTKHHVEYISLMLSDFGYSVSAIYGSMDQVARKIALSRFRSGSTSILVVTDLAARGIDVPGVENVINYDFPNGTRAFVHRVGRTARAGRKGWAFTFVTSKDLPHLIDLSLFLTRPIKTCLLSLPQQQQQQTDDQDDVDYANNLILGTAPRSLIELELETVRSLTSHNDQINILNQVAKRGQKMYERGLQKASSESYRRSKEMERKEKGLTHSNSNDIENVNPIFLNYLKIENQFVSKQFQQSRFDLLNKINNFKPNETVFEVGTKGKAGHSVLSQLMKDRRKAMLKSEQSRELGKKDDQIMSSYNDDQNQDDDDDKQQEDEDVAAVRSKRGVADMDEADEEELEAVFGQPRKKKRTQVESSNNFRDPNFYLDYEQEGADTERGYSLTNGESFVAQAAQSQYDVSGRGDTEGTPAESMLQRASTLKWDRKTKKFIKSNQLGQDNKKLIKSESGQKLPASFRSGLFDDWKKKKRVHVPKVGEQEISGRTTTTMMNGNGRDKRFRHKGGMPQTDGGSEADKRKGRRVGKPGKPNSVPGGLKGAAEIRKDRIAKERRVIRSTQPSKKNKGGKGGAGGGSGGGKGRRR
ncbi:ATP-dependent RNA helicase dbp10 [Microbotryomycetes sp. JL221]|nr:ATP-dependent RNA helicase dbp10 [Microbotryomycetes sp. JL221]